MLRHSLRSSTLLGRRLCQRYETVQCVSTFSGKHLNVDVKDKIAVVRLNSPNAKVNSLNHEVFVEVEDFITKFENSNDVTGAVIISTKPGNFIAGADISMLEKCSSEEELLGLSKTGHQLLSRIEKSEKPVVAAINGSCLGGGLEVVLACHWRIATKDKSTALGLPEVMLGLLPGSGGTQRLPALVGIPDALDMMLTGKHVRAEKAKKLGLVDQLVDPLGPGIKSSSERTIEYLEEVAIAEAKKLGMKMPVRKKSFGQKIKDYLLQQEFVQNYIFKKAMETVNKKTSGLYPAPARIIEAVKVGLQNGPVEGYKCEAEGFSKLGMTPECRGLINLYHGRVHCKKNHYGAPVHKANKVGILGAGLMGAGIAQVSIANKMDVILKDMASDGLARGLDQVYKGVDLSAKKRKISTFQRDVLMSNLQGSLSYEGFENLDIVIEAVFEDIKVKHKVVEETEKHISEKCIFASNTSALPIADIAKASKRPEKVIGMHYFSPVDKMELLEIVITDKTSKDTIAASVDVGLRQGKSVIVVKDAPGFYTTRILSPVLYEALRLLQEGVHPKELDSASKKMGLPIGIATLIDEVGIDVGYHIAVYLGGIFKDRFGSESNPSVLQELVAKNMCGRKTGAGIFMYPKGSKGGSREVNEEAMNIFKKYALTPKGPLSVDEMKSRLMSRFVNEAIFCLQEGILSSPADGDIGAVFGLGFPPFTGGPFKYVDTVGADQVLSTLLRLQDVYGKSFTPSPLLVDHAKDTNKKFYKR